VTTATGIDVNEDRTATIRAGIGLTAAAWLLSRLVVGIGWGPVRDPFRFAPDPWIHWDAFNYLDIAFNGTTFGHCSSAQFASQPNPEHIQWCGTVGWLPGYPWLMDVVHWTGMSMEDAGLLISWTALSIAIWLAWYGWCRQLSLGRAFVVMTTFALFPGAVYNFAIFPTSVALASITGAIIAATRERFRLSAVLMIAAGLCYPAAWFSAAGLAVGLVVAAIPLGRSEMIRRGLWGLAGLSSLVILALLNPGLQDYLTFQRQRGVKLSEFPGTQYLKTAFTESSAEQHAIGRASAFFLALQTVVSSGVAIAGLWLSRARNARDLYPAYASIAVFLGLILTNTSGSWNRSLVLAAPCVVCLRRRPIVVLAGLLVVFAAAAAILSRSFFADTLV
jgi:hypothetical protein